MGRVDQVPAGVDVHSIQQALHRTGTAPRHAGIDFRALLGHVNVRGCVGFDLQNRRQDLFDQGLVDRPQGVGRETHVCRRQAIRSFVKGREDLHVHLGIASETLLFVVGGAGAEAAVHIQDGQEGHGDSDFPGRGDATQPHLRRLRIGRSVRVVVQVVELGHRGVAGLLHLHVGECRNGLESLRVDLADHSIHQLAPAHEVATAASRFSQTGQQALMRMGVCIGHARYGNAAYSWRVPIRRSGFQACDHAERVDFHQDVPTPTLVREHL